MEYISEQAVRTVFNAVTVMFVANVMMDAVFSSDSDDEDSEVNQPPRTDRRFGQRGFIPRPIQFPRKNYHFNQFAEMLRTGSHLDPNHRDSRDFRGIFRVPPLFFEDIFLWFQARNEKESADCTGRPGSLHTRVCFPMSLKPFCSRRLQAQDSRLLLHVGSRCVGACCCCNNWLSPNHHA
jgi:hypothetical protein